MDKDPRIIARDIIKNLCVRVEKLCRYGPLEETSETDKEAVEDRHMVAELYQTYRDGGYSVSEASKKARIRCIRVVLETVFV